VKLDLRLRSISANLIATIDWQDVPTAFAKRGQERIAPIDSSLLVGEPGATTWLEVTVLIAGDVKDQPRIFPIGGDLLIALVVGRNRDRRFRVLVGA
jgi:hypothetical protein